MTDASHQSDIYSAIAAAEHEAFLNGFWLHQEGNPCPHGYGPGDHHWEAGTCLADARYAKRNRDGTIA